MTIDELLTLAVREGASDLHLETGEPPILRVHGEILRLERAPLTRGDVHTLVGAVMNQAQRTHFEAEGDLDFSYQLANVARFRVNAYRELRGEAANFRVIPSRIQTLDELGMPASLKEVCQRKRGLVLVTGPTGSGKSTTLAAMVDQVNENTAVHIVTIEDPIEFVHQPKKALLSQREVSTHTRSFSTALRAALREDPDVILVGEMRDLETISLALTAAETGHLVFATLHTTSAAKTVDRVIDAFPTAQQNQVRAMFSESLAAVVSQALCKKKGGGRVAALEVLIGTAAVRNLIREGKTHQISSAIQTGQKVGMQTFDGHLQELVQKGHITREEAQLRAYNPATFGGPSLVAS
jgi:twitching motility protein PilT